MSANPIPFNRPYLTGRELAHIAEAVAGGQVSGDGAFSRRCQDFLQAQLGVPRVLLTTSCTHALEMAAMLLDIGPGDEVVVPSFTFVSTANAFALRGARIVFADIRSDTLNLDEEHLDALLTPRTRAVVPVHYAGVGCRMDAIMETAGRHGVAVVEDNAHGLFGTYRDRALGTFGRLGTLSFHETKNFHCGEGGALLVNDPLLAGRAEIIREKGTDRSRFFRGEVDRYTWIDIGSSYPPSDILAAYLWAQFEARDLILSRRRLIWERYREGLADWASQGGVRLPTVPADCSQSWHMFHLVMPSLDDRQALIAHLRARAIQSVFHYVPLHLSAMGRRFGGAPGGCPVAEDISDRLVRLPFWTGMAEATQERVIKAIREFRSSGTGNPV